MRCNRVVGAMVALGLLGLAPAARAKGSDTAMVGPGVGSSDLLVSQGNKAYNDGQFPAARDAFLKAARVNPANAPVYLSLARAYLQTKDMALSCYTYRVFLKVSQGSNDRDKAQN